MGERKGQNKYYPPDYFTNPKVMAKGLDAYHGHHQLRERGKKAHLGILVIRFEMPYNIWCEGCNNHIGMGVRYNAEKQKVDTYYSTSIYEFKMKCHLCDNHFVIKTDPANLDYTIISGARRQENRWDPIQNEQVVPDTKETQHRLLDDAMFKLEHGLKDQNTLKDAKPAISRLIRRNYDVQKDNFEANLKLREQFRKSKGVEDADNENQQLAGMLKQQDKTRDKFNAILEMPSTTNVSKFYELKKEKLLSQKPANLGIVKKKQKFEETKAVASLVAAYSSSSDDEN